MELASEILKVVYNVTHSLASPDEEDEGHLMRLTEVLREYLVLSNTTEYRTPHQVSTRCCPTLPNTSPSEYLVLSNTTEHLTK